jgi:hypothetical protein
VDFNKIVTRAKNILLAPKTEWPVIADEPATVGDTYKNYVVFLAAIPAIFSFLGLTMLSGLFGLGFGLALTSAVVGYALSLGLLYVLALVVDALAPTFGGQKDMNQAFKVCAYSYTAGWLGSAIAAIVPILGFLISLAALVYGIYTLYLGLPHTMKTPADKAGGYTAVIVIVALIINIISGAIVGGIVGRGLWSSGSFMSSAGSSRNDTTFDENSTIGKLEKYAENMEAASKKMEAAQKSGDTKAQQDAMAGVMGAVFGGGAVESLAPDRLRSFIPESLAGRARTNISVERNNAMGMQISEAKASFANESGGTIDLEITDMGSAKGLIGLANFAGVEGEKETSTGYEKTYREDGRIITEEWDRSSSYGHFGIVLGERFSVKVQGNAGSINELKSALREVDLAGLERLKGEGVKK